MKSFLQKNWIVFFAVVLVLLVGGLVFAGVISVPSRQVVCTLEAKICSDGSAVGRTGPNCEFAECPQVPTLPVGYTLENYTVEKVTGVSCTKHADCTVPGEYAVQSRCLFVSLCLENSCAVICPSRINAVTFQCDGGKSIFAKFYPGNDTNVDLVLSDGRILSVPHAISASGARYATLDESFVFWNKGDTAFVTEGEQATYENCIIK